MNNINNNSNLIKENLAEITKKINDFSLEFDCLLIKTVLLILEKIPAIKKITLIQHTLCETGDFIIKDIVFSSKEEDDININLVTTSHEDKQMREILINFLNENLLVMQMIYGDSKITFTKNCVFEEDYEE